MERRIVKLLSRFYREMYSKIGTEKGILILTKKEKSLYALKMQGEVYFSTYTNNKRKKGIDDSFSEKDVLLGIGMLNECIDDINEKLMFFNSVMKSIKRKVA